MTWLEPYSEDDSTVATQQSFWLISDIFLTTFWRISDGFRLTWPIKIQGVLGAESWNLNGFSF